MIDKQLQEEFVEAFAYAHANAEIIGEQARRGGSLKLLATSFAWAVDHPHDPLAVEHFVRTYQVLSRAYAHVLTKPSAEVTALIRDAVEKLYGR